MAMPFLYQDDTAALLEGINPDSAATERSQIKAQLAKEGAVLFEALVSNPPKRLIGSLISLVIETLATKPHCLMQCALTSRHASSLPTRRPKRLRSFCTMKWLNARAAGQTIFLLSFGFRIGRRDTPLQE